MTAHATGMQPAAAEGAVSARTLFWAAAAAAWILFTWWYTNTGGPLTDEEVEYYINKFATSRPDIAANAGQLDRLRAFLESDTGNQFIMVNILDMADEPPDVPGATPGESSESLLGRYMEYMYPALLARACHPVYAGRAVAPALDLAGLRGADDWTQGALMRYRSRRDMMDITINPIFADRHKFKLAALDKTVAFPVENLLYLSDPRFLLGLIFFTVWSFIDLLVWRR